MLRKNIKRAAKKAIEWTVSYSSERIGPLRKVFEETAQKAAKKSYADIFINNSKVSKYDKETRIAIVERFERIDKEVNIATTPTDGLFMAETLLSMDCPGAMVECGSFNGGSTAKLSIIAKLLNRHLFVFDSFEGLPEVDSYNLRDLHARRSLQWVAKRPWTAGTYAGALDVVKANVEKYGDISACTFVKGWFNETLKDNLPNLIAFAFTDVDIPSSAKECLLHIWPRLTEGGVFYSHDIAYIKVLQSLNDNHLWKDVFNEYPPIFFGAGYGLCDSSPHLGFAVKGRVTADYIKSLTFDKRLWN